MKSHAEQLRKHQEQDFLGQPVFIGETFSQGSLHTLLTPAMHATLPKLQNSHMHGSVTHFSNSCALKPQTVSLISKQHALHYVS